MVVLLDSLNRHMLGAYGGTEFPTPKTEMLDLLREALRALEAPSEQRRPIGIG